MNKKKILSISAAVAMLVSTFSGFSASAEQYYPDVAENHWAYQWVDYMQSHGYIHGYPDGNYRPEQNITRAEYVTILKYILNTEGKSGKSYSDVNEGDWFYDIIHGAVAAGYLNGYTDGTMKPNNFITREEAAVIIAQAYNLQTDSDVSKFSDKDEISSWAVPYVGTLSTHAILMGDADTSNFRPKDFMSRAEVASIIAQTEIRREDGDLIRKDAVVLPETVENKDGAYYIDGITTNGLDAAKEFKITVTAEENGNLGEYAISARLGGETIADKVSPEELQNILNEKKFTPKELEDLEIIVSGLDNAEAGSSLNITISVRDSEKERLYAEKDYTISFGDADFKWPAAPAKITEKSYRVSGIETGYAKDMILSVAAGTTGEVGSYTITVKNGTETIANGVTIDELADILKDKTLTAEDLKNLVVTVDAASPADKSTLTLDFALSDAETGDKLSEKQYVIEFTNRTSSGTITGGSGTRETFETRDRVVESLKYYCNVLPSAASKITADKAGNASLTDDMLMIILTNDGLKDDSSNPTFNAAVSQTKNAADWKEVYGKLSIGESDADAMTYYNALKPVYDDVLKAVLADTALNYKANGSSIATANKEKYVGLFRGMVETINKCADAAISVYNNAAVDADGNIADGIADDLYNEFMNTAINDVTSVLANVYTTYSIVDPEKANINNAALAYCNNLFAGNTGSNQKSQLQTALTDARKGGKTLNVQVFAEILTKCINGEYTN